MREAISDTRLRFRLGDVRDLQRLIQAMRDTDIVVHAAAQKRVESNEADPGEARRTNVDGTENVALAAIESNCDRALYLSTDKAAAPNTTYGALKLTGERTWIGMNNFSAGRRTRFACSRYGNVMESTGSVIPLWRDQVSRGEPLTLTDRRMTRFLMPMDGAVDLVLHALRRMIGGEIFIPAIRAARMVDLAEAIAPSHPIREVGIRPGEKLHESLLTDDEIRSAFCYEGGFILEPALHPWSDSRPTRGVKVPEDFRYRSDIGEFLTVPELRELVAL
jgi:UDP-N-acetylglucosamine 4,6-dehydratase